MPLRAAQVAAGRPQTRATAGAAAPAAGCAHVHAEWLAPPVAHAQSVRSGRCGLAPLRSTGLSGTALAGRGATRAAQGAERPCAVCKAQPSERPERCRTSPRKRDPLHDHPVLLGARVARNHGLRRQGYPRWARRSGAASAPSRSFRCARGLARGTHSAGAASRLPSEFRRLRCRLRHAGVARGISRPTTRATRSGWRVCHARRRWRRPAHDRRVLRRLGRCRRAARERSDRLWRPRHGPPAQATNGYGARRIRLGDRYGRRPRTPL